MMAAGESKPLALPHPLMRYFFVVPHLGTLNVEQLDIQDAT
jgi:hypothetical protein